MLKKFLGLFSKDIGIDLGTTSTLVYVKGQGIVIAEPSVVAINKKSGQILSVGVEAKKMVGRTPSHIIAIKPLVQGVVSDFEITESMLKYFINKVHQGSFSIPRPRVVVGIPSMITEVEKKAVEDATYNAGAREVYLVEEPVAAAIGARLPIQEARGSMVIDIGGGTTDVAVLSLGGIVVSRSIKVAGERMNEDIIRWAQDRYNLLLGPRTAEEVKISIGSATPLKEILKIGMRGRDLVSGLPKEIIVTDVEIREAIKNSVRIIIDLVKQTIEETPPELIADIMSDGIILAGGGSLLRGFDRLVTQETKIAARVTEDPLTAVVRGTGIILEDLDSLKDVLTTVR
jgi:rod shape-determining protein MreB